ncbi:YneF family protein [Psychrobacillus sp.]|uniref:YneF family protein n=1 Tax=Psychrobacillus sp. TaxID=1871623 RepID=UPI0028BE4125|nr:YneF family protein [Psychrobacillus sp.]
MDTWIWIVIVIAALIGGAAIGFFAARQYMMKYLKENPPINEQMLRMMMAQMGRKPSEKQVKQMMNQMNKMQK